tara:strand:+ start:324 stop:1595 length:1272 start_codon:yes stop_codon:yes gene_type:complete
MKCIQCRNTKLKKIIDIGNQVISSLFYSKQKFGLKKYPLDLYLCENCKLIQLKKLAPMSEMYGTTYGYRTSLSPLMVSHMKKKYHNILLKRYTKTKNKVLDIGCNDGTFLNFFSRKGYKNLYGIDPSAQKFTKYHSKQIKLINDFFSKKKINRIYGNIKFDLITSFAMFYDIENPNLFCKEIKNLLNEDGIWILELSYWPMLIENMTYDQICHEHIAYYSLTVFKNLIEKHGLQINDFSFNEINGGSIEIICSKKKSKHKIENKKILNQLVYEKQINQKTYDNLNIRIKNTSKVLKNYLEILNKSKKKVYGYGAATKGNIILNQINANKKLIKFIADANPEKDEKFTPGTNIKIISKKKMRKLKPDYLLVLIWSFRNEVIKQELNYIKMGGKLIFHLPTLHIVDKDNYKDYLDRNFSSYSFKV